MSVNDDEILRVAARGDGVTGDGRHVAFAAPGDHLAADGSVVPGPHHQIPPCKHFPECGGCQLQHLDDISWTQFIADRVAGALAAQGLETHIRVPLLSPPNTRRRATLHAERRGRQVRLGFTRQNSHELIDLEECWVLAPQLFALLVPLRGMLAALIPGNRRINVHLAQTDQGVDVLIDGLEAEGLAAAEALSAFSHRHHLARLSIDEGFGPGARYEPEPVTVTLGGVPVPFPPGNFLQATPEGEAALVATVQEIVGEAKAVADLFAGLGTFTFAFPKAKVYAAEAARDSIMALKAAAGQAGRAVFAEHRDLFRRPVSAKDLSNFDAVVLDPPRAGAREQAGEIARSGVPLIAYVSCNPSTFARDAETLCQAGYRLDWVQPVGQFRWSTHVELAARFSR
ncbi:23S rRNA (uracil1939-C5)-methyltransferase [Sphingomonas naasensis]|uniref:Class I SAM-dependent RNA methyltransferase n=1 Tax=Sphingomonas naasensis TaxID=1344951 RepID=A0A4V3QXB2_9SPHN|nr:class I SAM-dependent RNA methyltransferase [Sphingomonas naasensis]NIJ18593.1 23S rRNA (uracil1939-C5)-methyltransferase [Sphingomonas naasensis]TGX45842.1 class I SAM-dependent RNA methyltransferase [Sphingomonas naasensis]